MNKEFVLISGGSSGIGRDVATYLNQQGKQVILVGRNAEAMKELCDGLQGDNYYFQADLKKPENIASLFQKISELQLKMSGFVYSAGICETRPIKINDIKKTEEMLDINANSFLEMSKFFCKKKFSVDEAKIVAISSIEAVLKEKGFVSYAASKNLLEVYVKILAKENTGRKICVNAIRPANVKTPMYERAIADNDSLEKSYLENQPLGIIDVRQISYLVEYLLSDKARYITGTSVDVSAGWSC